MEDESLKLLRQISNRLLVLEQQVDDIASKMGYLQDTSKKMESYTWLLDKLGTMIKSPFSLLGFSKTVSIEDGADDADDFSLGEGYDSDSSESTQETN